MAEATELLRHHQGLFVTAIQEAATLQSSEGRKRSSGGVRLRLGSNKTANLAMFSRHLDPGLRRYAPGRQRRLLSDRSGRALEIGADRCSRTGRRGCAAL